MPELPSSVAEVHSHMANRAQGLIFLRFQFGKKQPRLIKRRGCSDLAEALPAQAAWKGTAFRICAEKQKILKPLRFQDFNWWTIQDSNL